MFLPTLLIVVPCLILIIIGGVYQVAPRHLDYHREVIAALGNRVLENKLHWILPGRIQEEVDKWD